MTTPINTFEDILDAMERDPALRDALRRHVLTDELLQVPCDSSSSSPSRGPSTKI